MKDEVGLRADANWGTLKHFNVKDESQIAKEVNSGNMRLTTSAS